MIDCHQFISIILPVRNEEYRISAVLDAILSANYLRDQIEIILSDGMSEDRTWMIVEEYQKQYPFILMIKNPMKFVSTGFNLALNQAKGNVIIRIDGHCDISPNYLENCLELLKNNDADIVGGVIETCSIGYIGRAIAIAQSAYFGVGGVKFRDSECKNSSYVDTLAFGAHKREIFSEIGGYDEEMVCNQDDEFNCRAIQAGKKIWMDPAIKTKYYSRSSFIKLFKQYFNYGCFKVRGIQKRRQIVSIRHFIPAMFIIILIGTLILGYFLHQPWFFFLVFFSYLIINILSSIIISPIIPLIPLVFLSFWTLHLGYGSGFIWGLIRFIGKWGDRSLKDSHFNREQFTANNSISSLN